MTKSIVEEIPHGLRETLVRELAPDEYVVWSEMPAARFFTPGSTASVVFAIPWIGFTLLWMQGVSASEDPQRNSILTGWPLLGLPFLIVGCFILLAPLWTYRMARRSLYVITNRRAISFEYGWGMTIRSYPPDKLKNVFRRERKHGRGDVVIAFEAWKDSDGDRHREDLGFKDIRDPQYVESLLKNLAQQARIEVLPRQP